jgi:hypothetical protein
MTKTGSWIGQGCADFVAPEIIPDQLFVHQPLTGDGSLGAKLEIRHGFLRVQD